MPVFWKKIDVEPLLNRIRELETAVESLQRGRKALDLEFTELYDKVSHQMSRMAKRYSAAAKVNGAEPEEELEPGPLDHLDPISRSIMLRRGGAGRTK